MTTPRNAKRHAPRLEALEERLCMAVSVGWDGLGRGSASLTYYIADAPSSLTQAAVQAALQTALDAWAAVADISFTRTSQPNQSDSIDFTFGTLDGPGGTLAEAYLPDDVNTSRIAGDIQFDASEVWEVGNALGGAAMDLVLTAAHEIGHALGLEHSNLAGSIMAPAISPDEQFTGLDRSDEAAILELYAAARPAKSTTPTTPTTRTTPTTTPTTPTIRTTPTTTPTTPTTRTTPTTAPTTPTTRTTPTTIPTTPTTTPTTPRRLPDDTDHDADGSDHDADRPDARPRRRHRHRHRPRRARSPIPTFPRIPTTIRSTRLSRDPTRSPGVGGWPGCVDSGDRGVRPPDASRTAPPRFSQTG